MFRDNHFNKEHINVFFDNGGLGDHICCMIAVKYMKDYAPNIIQHVWVPDYFLDVAKNLVPGIIVKPFSKSKEYKLQTTVKMSNDQHTSLGVHLVDFAFNVLVDKQVEIEHKNYCKLQLDKINVDKFNLPEKYVVLTCGFTSGVREMLPSVVNGIIDYCKSVNCPIVMLGNHLAKTGRGDNIKGNFNTEINFDDTVNLVNKTTLLEAGKIISKSNCIIGLDNGLLHLAGCTDVPIIAGFSTVEPRLRLPYRNNELGWNCYTVTPDDTLKCRFCQSKMVHIYNHDFRNCFYGDKLCLSQMTADKYIYHLKKLI